MFRGNLPLLATAIMLNLTIACSSRPRSPSPSDSTAGIPKEPETVIFDRPDAEFPEPFTNIRGLVELSSGKVLVADAAEETVQLVDLTTSRAAPVGRKGRGPGEYTMAGGLYPSPDGGALLNDPLEWRFLVLDSNATPIAVLSHPSGTGTDERRIHISGRGYADRQGAVYFEASPFSHVRGEGQFIGADSVPIQRWDRVVASLDTVAWIRVPKAEMRAFSEPGGEGRSIAVSSRTAMIHFMPEETWGVAGDGAVARVTAEPYRVTWYPPNGGSPVPGPIQPYTPIPVTQADKDAVIAARERERRAMVTVTQEGAKEAKPGAPPPAPPLQFAETKPPFLGGKTNGATPRVIVSPEGEVWVPRTAPAGDSVVRYDVFDRSALVVRRVIVGPRRAVIGFGKGVVYMSRTDEDDLQHLERFEMPGSRSQLRQ